MKPDNPVASVNLFVGGHGMLDLQGASDIDYVISYLSELGNHLIWLTGESRGTESAAHIAIESKQKPYCLIINSNTAFNEIVKPYKAKTFHG